MKRLVRRKIPCELDVDSPVLSRLFAARGIDRMDQLDWRVARLAPPDDFKGLANAATLLADALAAHDSILILGDFDADGATSCALMVSALGALGASRVNYLVPNRFEYGYGLTPEIVEASRQFEPDLIVTVDNGISSIEGVAHAQSLGIKVLITDHHLPGDTLPGADAIVNPNQPGCEFPSKHLAGVGVAFYVLMATRAVLRERGWFADRGIAEPNLADYLDLVALGTIADVVTLDFNNRILVNEGIKRIRAGRTRPGILALIRQSGASSGQVMSRDLAFGVAPRLNAAGRLEDISLGIECLLSTDEARAYELAARLDELNRERREIEGEMKAQALDVAGEESWLVPRDAIGVSLFHETWHQGVVGIVAARVKDKMHRPAIAFARAGDDELKGSARSIPGLHIRDALDAIAARHPGLVMKFGGHAMAAGLSLHPDKLRTFAAAFDDEARRWLSAEDLEQRVVSDGEFEGRLTLEMVRHVLEAAPWGHGFPEPLFDGEFEILDQRIIASKHLKLRVRRRNDAETLDAIAFNHPSLLEGHYKRLAYRLDINDYRGLVSPQLIVEATDIG